MSAGDKPDAATRLPSEVEAFASVAQAIRDSYEPIGAHVHVNPLFRSITITVPATGRSGVEYDWHIKWRRSPK